MACTRNEDDSPCEMDLRGETCIPEWFIWTSDQGYPPLDEVKRMVERFGKDDLALSCVPRGSAWRTNRASGASRAARTCQLARLAQVRATYPLPEAKHAPLNTTHHLRSNAPQSHPGHNRAAQVAILRQD